MHNLNAVVWSNIVLINSLQPSNVVVGMRNQMNIQLAFHHATPCVVLHITAINGFGTHVDHNNNKHTSKSWGYSSLPHL